MSRASNIRRAAPIGRSLRSPNAGTGVAEEEEQQRRRRRARFIVFQINDESDRAKPAHGGVKTKNFAQIVLIYAGLERSELASASAKHKQLIAAVFDALLPSRPWFCPRKPRALPPVAGEAGCSVAADDLCHGYLAPICSAMSPLFLARPLPLHFPLL